MQVHANLTNSFNAQGNGVMQYQMNVASSDGTVFWYGIPVNISDASLTKNADVEAAVIAYGASLDPPVEVTGVFLSGGFA